MIYTAKKVGLLFIIPISCLMLCNFSIAENEGNADNGDCRYVTQTGANFGTILESRSGQDEIIYPKESIKRALLNLKSACCNRNKIGSESPTCKSDKENGLLSDIYPKSIFLYDHLVDIGFRRLDAIEDLLYEGVTPDNKGKERRDFINNKGSQEEGTVPTDIMPKFKEQWTQSVLFQLPIREDGNYKNQYQNKRTEKTQSYDSRPLINRYGNICEISAYIYGYLGLDLNTYTRTYGYKNCLLLSPNIIGRNILFTKAIVLKKSNKLLYDNVNAHATNYISKTRLEKLRETILGIVQAFNTINKKVIKLIKECS